MSVVTPAGGVAGLPACAKYAVFFAVLMVFLTGNVPLGVPAEQVARSYRLTINYRPAISRRGSGGPLRRVAVSARLPPEAIGRMPSILVAEDDPGVRDALCELLRLEGFEVRGIADGAMALALLHAQKFDLLITGLNFPAPTRAYTTPRSSGLEIIRKLRGNTRTAALPIIVMSAYDDQEELRQATACGANAVFQKPVVIDDFFAAITALANGSQFDDRPAPTRPAFDLILPVAHTIEVINARLSSTFRDHPERLRLTDPFVFERVIAELFEEEGYESILTRPRADGGKDIYVSKTDPFTKVTFWVQCKRYVPPNKVDVTDARELYGVAQEERASGGIIVTTSYFTRPARAFADKVPLQLFLRDFDFLAEWLKRQKLPRV
jgi:CheY-like chemotaxis protein